MYNQLSYLSQNNVLDPSQSGFRTAHSTETALLTVTESLHAARVRPAHSSLFSVTYRLCSNLVHIISDKSHLSGQMEWLPVQTLLSGNWCPSRLSTKTTCFHYILDHWALQSHHMDSLTTVMQTTPKCSDKSCSAKSQLFSVPAPQW